MIAVVDLGGTKTAIGLVDPQGLLICQTIYPTRMDQSLESGIAQISKEIFLLLSSHGSILKGIGIGCTGQIQSSTGFILQNGFIPGWEGTGLVTGLSETFQVPVSIINDAEAAALGEWSFGVGKCTRTFMTVTVGTGIGVGLLIDGRCYRGLNDSHPEIGHHIIDPSGPLCFCGAYGCWESLASGTALERWAAENRSESTRLTGKMICDLARKGDPFAEEAVNHIANYLGLGLCNLITLFSPEVIALSGGLMESASLFLPVIHEILGKCCKLVPHHPTQIQISSLQSQAVLLGAYCFWKQKYQ